MKDKKLEKYIQSIEGIVGDTLTGAARETLVEITTKFIQLNNSVISYEEISGEDDVSLREFSSEGEVSLSEPEFFDELPEVIHDILGIHRYSRPFLLEVPNVIVQAPEGHTRRAEDGRYIVYNYGKEGTKHAARSLAYDIVIGLSHGSVPPVRSQTDDMPRYDLALSLLSPHTNNYTHWAQECLTRLEAFEHYVEQTGKRPTILLPEDPPAFVNESLSLLGHDEQNCVEVNDGRVRIDQLVMPTPRRFLNNKSGEGWLRVPEAFDWVSDRAIEAIDGSEAQYSSRVVISREDASTRRMTNRGEVVDQLSEYGFEKYVPGTMSYEEQVRLFSQADFVVGAHGAGMINCIYANDASLLELYGDHFLPANYELAQGQGRPYGCLHCDPVDKDFRVNAKKLTEAVALLENLRQND